MRLTIDNPKRFEVRAIHSGGVEWIEIVFSDGNKPHEIIIFGDTNAILRALAAPQREMETLESTLAS